MRKVQKLLCKSLVEYTDLLYYILNLVLMSFYNSDFFTQYKNIFERHS